MHVYTKTSLSDQWKLDVVSRALNKQS